MKSLIPIALLSATTCNAFAPTARTTLTSTVLIPHRNAPSSLLILQKSTPSLSSLYMMEDNDTDENDTLVDTPAVKLIVDETTTNNNALAKLGNKLKQTFSTNPQAAALFLSIFIFLLPILTSFPQSAMAVQSGGRMGGSFGSGGGSSSSRQSYSAPSSSSYSRGYSRGYSTGGSYYSRPNVIVSPSISPWGYSPFYSPFTPFYARPSGVVVSSGPSFFSLFLFAGFALFVASALSSFGSSTSDTLSSITNQSVLGSGVSVAEISVALEVPNRDSPNSILSSLDRLSRTARTDSRVGLQDLTSQVAIELLRRKSSIVAASTRASHYRDENKAEREYNNISIRERGKFQRETVSKYGGVDYSDTRQSTSSEYSKATVAVVTIVVLIDGDSTSKALSGKVNSIRDVEDALSRLAADVKVDNCLRGAEILWTPEERDETLTMKDVFADYSSLRSV